MQWTETNTEEVYTIGLQGFDNKHTLADDCTYSLISNGSCNACEGNTAKFGGTDVCLEESGQTYVKYGRYEQFRRDLPLESRSDNNINDTAASAQSHQIGITSTNGTSVELSIQPGHHLDFSTLGEVSNGLSRP